MINLIMFLLTIMVIVIIILAIITIGLLITDFFDRRW